jgi:predicted Zn-ribbon and HTH transcriptional regulator
MRKLSMRTVKGWLTHDDIEKLEEAAKRPLKYAKCPAKRYNCTDCGYNWLYSSVKCPVCASSSVKRLC